MVHNTCVIADYWGKMLNGVNNNDGILNSQLDKQNEVSKVTTNPIKNPYQNSDKNLLIDETSISSQAVKLYQREQDIKNFTKLAMSDPEDMSHENIIDSLFRKGISDPFADEALSGLADNQRLLDDLGL